MKMTTTNYIFLCFDDFFAEILLLEEDGVGRETVLDVTSSSVTSNCVIQKHIQSTILILDFY